MMMTPFKLILLRIFNITFGRMAFFSLLLRKTLEKLMITGKKEKYVASSRYFDIKELDARTGGEMPADSEQKTAATK